jgi:hypothetical protein
VDAEAMDVHARPPQQEDQRKRRRRTQRHLLVGDLVLDPDHRLIDRLRSHDLSGWAKALWFIFILLLPPIGVLVYLIARGGKMHEHAVRDTQVQEQQFCSYVQGAAGSQSPADQLAKLADLRDRGVITAAEFEREKAKILA